MALPAEFAFSILSSYPLTSSKLRFSLNLAHSSSITFHSFRSTSAIALYGVPFLSSSLPINKSPAFQLRSALESQTVEQDVETPQNPDARRKLFVLNLPWSFSVQDIKKLFGECGPVDDVEIIKQKNGKNRGFAFVTMSSGEEAQAAIEKYDSYELSGRIIRVELAKRFKKPTPIVAEVPQLGETRHKVYVSNISWKVRSNNLREFFSLKSNPISARVVFESQSGRSSGYGFVSFATEEEAASAISEFNGEELLGRPIQLKLSERRKDPPAVETKEEEGKQEQPQQ